MMTSSWQTIFFRIFLVAGGAPAKVLMYQAWQLLGRKDTFIDIGSSLDGLVGIGSRDYNKDIGQICSNYPEYTSRWRCSTLWIKGVLVFHFNILMRLPEIVNILSMLLKVFVGVVFFLAVLVGLVVLLYHWCKELISHLQEEEDTDTEEDEVALEAKQKRKAARRELKRAVKEKADDAEKPRATATVERPRRRAAAARGGEPT
eukprot:gnl/TRDRNA2_/TRDRNA2_81955_c0_seq1.p1 gnl/TRDRNA2_/TRDRNA2_81955_c0~~gnl/TRDRNA2_/TRDRNA2_81955_c0_seq1.p1  ORF type:complete len:203 (+),score=33.20 gnl/TRDRNA2_/TRDRNA2_81955_c0_seq1:87-695(+)